jgi:hypothetical protein
LQPFDHGKNLDGTFFRPLKGHPTRELHKLLHSILVTKRQATQVGIAADVNGFCWHSLCVTVALKASSGRRRLGTSLQYDGSRAAREGCTMYHRR